MTSASTPLIASRVTLAKTAEGLQAETGDISFLFTGESAGLAERALPRLDGSRSAGELAAELSVSAGSLLALIESLAEESLVIDSSGPLRAATAREFLDALYAECEFWSQETFAKPFWRQILGGAATPQLVLGWGIEFYHFVDSANEYMAAGAANCREDTVVREWLAAHYVEEWDHAAIFLRGLADCGMDEAQIKTARPLASTRALINSLYELASWNSYCYATAFAVMQPSRSRGDRAGIAGFYGHLTKMYPFAKGMFAAFEKHALIDVELGHNEIVLDKIAGRHPERLFAHRAQMLAVARGLVENFVMFFEGIAKYYGQAGVAIPRQALATELQIS